MKKISFSFFSYTYYTICLWDLSPPTMCLLGVRYDLLDDLIHNMQLYASTQGYTACHLCTKKSPRTGLLEIYYLCCDWGRKERIPTRQKQKHDGSRINDYPFSIVAKMTEGSWSIWEIQNPNYNHSSTIAASHPSLNKIYLTSTIVSEIEQVIQVNLKPSAIVNSLRLAQGSEFDDNQPTYKTRDIYNVKTDLRQKNLGVLTPIQVFLHGNNIKFYIAFLFWLIFKY